MNERKMNNITIQNIALVRTELTKIIDKAFEKKLDRWSMVCRFTMDWFLNQECDDRIIDALNSVKGAKDVHAASSAFAYRFKFPQSFINDMYAKKGHYKSLYAVEMSKMMIGASVIDALGELGLLKYELKESHHKTVTGRVNVTLVPWYSFVEKEDVKFDKVTGFCKGVSDVPGVLGQSKMNVHSWESPKKYTRDMKEDRRNRSSIPMHIINRTREQWTEMFKSEKWYTVAIRNCDMQGKEPRGLINARVEELVDGMIKLQEYDRLYIQWGFQPSTRDLCLCTVEGLAPHGKYKYSWEFADDRVIDQYDVDACKRVSAKMYAKKILKEKINTKAAMKLYDKEPQVILDWLATGYGKDFNEKIYFEGLIQMLTDGVGGKTKRMIYEDLSSNGPGIFGSNFRLEKFARLSNLTHRTSIQDGHQEIADACGIKDTEDESARDLIKQLASNSLTHGGGTKGIAKLLGLDIAELNNDLKKVYGEEFAYMNFMAKHVGQLMNSTKISTEIITPDGYIGINQAYAEKHKFELKYLSLRTKTLRSISMVRNMPIMFENSSNKIARMVFLKDKDGKEVGSVKNMGGFANSIHGLDAYMKRRVDKFLERIGLGSLDIHDNFGTTGLGLHVARRAVLSTHVKFWKQNCLLGMIHRMEDKSTNNVGRLQLKTGDLGKNELLKATEFFQP